VATGVGFLGAGTILKHSDAREITGLTTAAGIWLTAAIGLTVGIGRLWVAIVCAVCAWAILSVLAAVEHRIGGARSR
jgi:putative Mg2+ transporter-C (MgtC) family protein